MNLTEDQLSELKNLSSLFFSVEDILIALELPAHALDEFQDIIDIEKLNPIYQAYHIGRLKTEIELRTSIKKAALNGSNPAQSAMMDFRTDS